MTLIHNPEAAMAALTFFISACVGSFLNVCIHRIPLGQSVIHPPSHCPSCGQSIPFYLNIPILSYLFLGGKCRFCRTHIPVRYVLVEGITALIGLGLFFRFGLGLPWIFWFSFAALLVTITFIDIDHQIIPDTLSLPGILMFASSPLVNSEMTLWKSAAGILLGGGIPYLVAWGYLMARGRQGLGGGDIKLMAMIGAATGVNGVLFTLFFGSVLGSVYGLAATAGKSGRGQIKIPFGPFLSLGALIYVFQGKELIHWYLTGGLSILF